jgi:uncharacterized protein (UPF0297 family)
LLETTGERVKIKEQFKDQYKSLATPPYNALNRFVDSLEATLDKNDQFYFFPAYDED